MKLLQLFIGCALISCTGPIASAQKPNGWTIMYYAAGGNSSEGDLMVNVEEMINGKTSDGYEIILLIDRIEGHSNDTLPFGEDFTDTRLYKLGSGTYEELDGKEFLSELKPGTHYDANMSDANLLKRFIQYSKKYYPAEHYMLIMRSHGNGMSLCPDDELEVTERMFPGEMQDVLSADESVDILGLDVCNMASLENFYEWRKGDKDQFAVDYIISSAPAGQAWEYERIFSRLNTKQSTVSAGTNYFNDGAKTTLDPYSTSPLQLATLFMEEIYSYQPQGAWSLFDNSGISDLKARIDDIARDLVNEDRATILQLLDSAAGYYHHKTRDREFAKLAFPHIDAYDLFDRISGHSGFKPETRAKAAAIAEKVDQLIIHSYHGEGGRFCGPFEGSIDGKNGVFLTVPLGHHMFEGRSFWAQSAWFHPDDRQNKYHDSYGKYDWCSDGAIRGNNKVENFFEFLDYLFDESNTETGGVNKYQW